MRLTEYIHWITREDLNLGQNEKDWIAGDTPSEAQIGDYTHFKPTMKNKRERYLYQCKLKGKTPVK